MSATGTTDASGTTTDASATGADAATTGEAGGPAAGAADLTDKQTRILAYLRENAGERTYFKSRLIAEDLGMTAKEVGANMTPLLEGDFDVAVEKWGYSSGTTWMVTT